MLNKTVCITGASRGIGRAIACRFAKEGYNLILNCHNSADLLEELKDELIRQYHCQILCFIGDVGEFSFVEQIIKESLATFKHIDILINNAGIAHIGLLSDMSIDDWNQLVATNLTSVFSTCKCTVPSMVQKQSGKIINISSIWGISGASCEVAYSACKGGINAFTKGLAKELAPSNIQVNAIACGVIDTEMNACFSAEERSALEDEIPAGRYGTPEEVAELAFSLATGHPYLTGQIITLDGGYL